MLNVLIDLWADGDPEDWTSIAQVAIWRDTAVPPNTPDGPITVSDYFWRLTEYVPSTGPKFPLPRTNEGMVRDFHEHRGVIELVRAVLDQALA